MGRPKLGMLNITIQMKRDDTVQEFLNDMKNYLEEQKNVVSPSLLSLIDDMQIDIDRLLYLFKLN